MTISGILGTIASVCVKKLTVLTDREQAHAGIVSVEYTKCVSNNILFLIHIVTFHGIYVSRGIPLLLISVCTSGPL